MGAMICLLCSKHSVPNFYFRTTALKPYSIIKHFGQIDNAGTIKHGDVLYRDLKSDKGRIELPIVGEGETRGTPWLEMRGDMHLGYRQLSAERWSASPLYTLRFTPKGSAAFSRAIGKNGEAPVLRIRLGRRTFGPAARARAGQRQTGHLRPAIEHPGCRFRLRPGSGTVTQHHADHEPE